MYSHYLNQSQNIFINPKRTPIPISSHSPFLTPTPNPRQIVIYFLSLWICPLWTLHTNGIIQCVRCCVWLLPLSIFSRFIHVVAWIGTSRLFTQFLIRRVRQILPCRNPGRIFYCMHTPHSVYPFIRGGTFGLFPLGGHYKQCSYAHSCTRICVDICFHFSWVYLGVQLLVHMLTLRLTF